MQHFLLVLYLATYSASSVQVAAIPDFNCADGCPKTTPRPVCGSDQRTYGSACFAYCQGVTSYTEGACTRSQALANSLASEEDMAAAAVTLSEGSPEAAAPVVSLQAMTQFKDEGFNFIGVARTGPQFRVRETVQTFRKDGRPYGRRFRADPNVPSSLLRLVADGSGYLYSSEPVYMVSPSGVDTTVSTAPEYNPEAADSFKVASEVSNITTYDGGGAREVVAGGKRRLSAVIGTDEREKVATTKDFPWRTIGHMVSFINLNISNLANVCTGTVIGKNLVLTAAHCLYDSTGRGSFRNPTDFRPALIFDHYPFGVYRAEWYFLFEQYLKRDLTYDVALIKTVPSGNLGIGDLVGAMGRSWGDRAHVNLPIYSAGYPVDKDNGLVMNKVKCIVANDSVTDREVFHTCDTFSGQSGSPVWTETSRFGAIWHHIIGVQTGWQCQCCRSFSPCTAGRGTDGCCIDTLKNVYTPFTYAIGQRIHSIVELIP